MRLIEHSIYFLALWIYALINELLADWLSKFFNIPISLISIVVVVILSMIILVWLYKRKKLSVDINVDVLKEDYQKKEHAHRGLVIILSAFTPFKNLAKFKQDNPVEFNKALVEKDIDKLMLDNVSQSNFGPPVVALKAHKEKLEHVWLVCSKSSSGETTQSINYAPLLEKYIHEKINSKIIVHYGDIYTVLLDDDSSVCRQSFKVVQKIYKEAKKIGIKTKDMITDVTGGIKPINTGAILACLNRDEDIQVIGTAYDDEGKHKGESFPMIIEYKPSIMEI